MKKITTTLLLAIGLSSFSQQKNYTEQDSLRGSITPERSWWDLNFYNLSVEVKPDEKYISGSNIIRYTVLEEQQRLQVDLQTPLIIEKITQEGKDLKWESNGNAHFVTLKKPQRKGEVNEIKVYYSGHPKEAVRAPWDGGFSWKKDNNGKHFVATSCQGLGASVWWPNKDHMYDEVDSMAINITTPKDLMDVSNGRLLKVVENKDSNTYHWYVSNPINNYGVNINIGDYVHFGEFYNGEKGKLAMDYYVLRDNEEKAKEQFKQAPMMMEALEHWFGPYPFYEDGYKLVEVPYPGMEHQSSVTYGNQFKNGYLGRDVSKTGWGLKFDFILIHESGHEWFANNITYKDIADMWVHEGFTAYSENLYVDYHFGKEAASEYVIGTRGNIQNDKPIIGTYDVNQRGSGDMYSKGANMLHSIRQLVDDDEKWRTILRGLNREFYHQTVTTKQIEEYISNTSGIDLTQFFDQYLRNAKIPMLEYQVNGKQLRFRYTNIVNGFDMPLRLSINGSEDWVYPTSDWKSKSFKKDIQLVNVDKNFYVEYKKI
ncbi:M1 family metallopeptidase [Arenibacter palladensis]|uniref:M1 family metallopeptidase n=1 Tax=Arenibacter palladensis TaxID=237373 RepID=UPI0026E2481D|nr:M1 family metallopeptidase [Arenibacter palladensis]MDO6601981.1 M1 family metallopeptidase [Arenibacter palladensis]